MIVVQVGTNTGNDHVLKFCKTHRPEQIFLIEPIPIHEVDIRRNYAGMAGVTLVPIAITPGNETEVTLYYHDRDGPAGHPRHHYEVTSMNPDHLVKHGYARHELRAFQSPAMTLNQFLESRQLRTIDYLFLDVEGIDFEVLQSLDLSRFDIGHIQIEHLHLNKPELLAYMKDRGYEPLDFSLDASGFDTLFRKVGVYGKR